MPCFPWGNQAFLTAYEPPWWLSHGGGTLGQAGLLSKSVPACYRDPVLVILEAFFRHGTGISGKHDRGMKITSRWWFQIFFLFTPIYLGKIFTHFDDSNIFQMGWFNHQLDPNQPSKIPIKIPPGHGWVLPASEPWNVTHFGDFFCVTFSGVESSDLHVGCQKVIWKKLDMICKLVCLGWLVFGGFI